MKKRLLILALSLIVVVTAVFSMVRWRAYHRALYEGRHARDWAVDYSTSMYPTNREAAAVALRALGSNAVPALIDLLHERDKFYEKPMTKNARRIPFGLRTNLFTRFPPGAAEWKRYSGACALAFIGPDAAGAIPALVESTQDPSDRVGWMAAQALGKIGSRSLPPLLQMANDVSFSRRAAAIYALGYVPEKPAGTISALMFALADTNLNVRLSAQFSLIASGTSALPAICERLRDHDPIVHTQLVAIVNTIRPPHQMLLIELIRQTRNVSPAVRLHGVEALSNLGLSNLNTVTAFTRLLNDPEESVRRVATNGLAQITGTNSP